MSNEIGVKLNFNNVDSNLREQLQRRTYSQNKSENDKCVNVIAWLKVHLITYLQVQSILIHNLYLSE